MEIDYCVVKDAAEHSKEMEETITREANQRPIIVFVNKKNQVGKLKTLCATLDIPFFSATSDTEMATTLGVIGNLERGLVAALDSYGRGIDIRFKVDSFVLIGFLPERLEAVKQMSGRSSRTMKKHFSKLVCIDKLLLSGR